MTTAGSLSASVRQQTAAGGQLGIQAGGAVDSVSNGKVALKGGQQALMGMLGRKISKIIKRQATA